MALKGDGVSRLLASLCFRARRIQAALRAGRLSAKGADERLQPLALEGRLLWEIRMKMLASCHRVRGRLVYRSHERPIEWTRRDDDGRGRRRDAGLRLAETHHKGR